MIIQVRANNPASDGRSRAGRRFANGVIYRMELVPDPQSGAPHDAKAFLDEDGNPDMARISQAGLAQIKADPVMSIVPSEEDTASVADYPRVAAELEAAQARIDELAADLETARARTTELEQANASLKDQASALADENKALKATIAKAAKKGAAAADQSAATPPAGSDAPSASTDAPPAAPQKGK